MKENPIGIFDSGVGGLTVANAIHQLLPGENLIYFGDTAHVPYGDKSKETIASYSARITEFLLEQSCKVILIACNTASANAVVEYVVQQNKYKHIGVIGTKGTINSGSYVSKIIRLNPHLTVSSLATPMLVPMIEEGFIFDDISNAIIRTYLSKPEISHIDSLVLGCTHYPIIRNQISKYYNFTVDVIDSSKIVATHLRKILDHEKLLNPATSGTSKFLVSDYTDYFQAISKLFFEEEIKLEKISLWNAP
jgi:glutamate racemase